MTQQMELLGRYKQLRQVGLPLNNQLVRMLTKADIEGGAAKIGIFRDGKVVLEEDSTTGILMDFCLHDIWRDGTNAIDRFYRTSPPPPHSDEMLILQAKRASRYSMFMVDQTEPGSGLHVRDLLYDEDVFITDINFSQTKQIGLVIACRLMTIDGINMTTGATIPMVVVPRADRWQFMLQSVRVFKKKAAECKTPEERSEFIAEIIRTCLENGAASRISYADPPGAKVHRRPLTPRPATRIISAKKKLIGPNDRCPCGSGRKVKNCCGA